MQKERFGTMVDVVRWSLGIRAPPPAPSKEVKSCQETSCWDESCSPLIATILGAQGRRLKRDES